ncbi:MAG: hypothetical protein RLY66_658 [Candidatus Parcubacteria bacterium]|jgi:cytochrome c biogenesis protein CcdA/thiol-disulfide isomerase/thioredoxin
MFLLLISFIGGILTVLAPCILPLLPVIVGGSLSDGHIHKKKAFTIIGALGLSVIAFTLLLKASTLLIDIPEYVWKVLSGGIVLALGIITLFPSLWENKFLARMSARSNIALGKGNQKKSFWGDVIVGAALGPVFSTCSPTYFIVLATVLPVNLFLGTIYLLSYAIGLCLALLVVTFVGQKIMSKLDIAADPRGIFKRVLGIIFIIVGIAILSGYDKKLEAAILNSGFFDVTKLEQKLLQGREAARSTGMPDPLGPVGSARKAPEISSPDGFINTDGQPLTLAGLKGKVVLLDIWTYSCINCQRTLPYLNEWYAKYKDQGLEIVGLHTPEFAFEKVQTNVEKAVEKFGIKYPVVLDNDYSTWNALGNQYWPRKYLIDENGYIVYDHIGEGGYGETEKAIQDALKKRADRLGMQVESVPITEQPVNAIAVDSGKVDSPEIYFGSARNSLFGNGIPGVSGERTFTIPAQLSRNKFYLNGLWNMTPEYAENSAVPAEIVFGYEAKNVYMAAGSMKGVEIEIYRDDILIKKITIKDDQLYTLIEGSDYGRHTLRIKVLSPGLKAFTFTFG